jgi:hypothetical protein
MEGDSTASGCGDRSGVVENENDWGLGDEVLEDLAVESHAASARGGAGASHTSHNSRSAACVPSMFELVELGAYLLVLSLPQVITSMKPHGALAM